MSDVLSSSPSTAVSEAPSLAVKTVMPPTKPFWLVLVFLIVPWILAGIILFIGQSIFRM